MNRTSGLAGGTLSFKKQISVTVPKVPFTIPASDHTALLVHMTRAPTQSQSCASMAGYNILDRLVSRSNRVNLLFHLLFLRCTSPYNTRACLAATPLTWEEEAPPLTGHVVLAMLSQNLRSLEM